MRTKKTKNPQCGQSELKSPRAPNNQNVQIQNISFCVCYYPQITLIVDTSGLGQLKQKHYGEHSIAQFI